jgi:signal transduction histidine kinase
MKSRDVISNRKQRKGAPGKTKGQSESELELAITHQIANIFLTISDEDMYWQVLNVILDATESKYGIFGYIDEQEALVIPSMPRGIWKKRQIPNKTIIYPREAWDDSWGRALVEKKTFYANEGLHVPDGHIPLQRVVCVPIIHRGKCIGLLEVANKMTDYGQEDVQVLESLGNQIAPILNARLQRDRQDEARKKAEEELKKTVAELERSNAELEQFAYFASHDLQEPLRMVSSYTQLIEKRYKDKLDADAHDFINFAVDGAKRMQQLINDLLTYSRVGTRGKPLEPASCKKILHAAIANLDVAIRESGAAVTHDPLPPVMADETQLLQLFQNLIGNAVKFHGKKPPHVHVSAKPQGNKWVFSVKDNGIGIDPQYFERIFIIFQRLHSEGYPGTGTGLAIVKRIVERHGGRIWVESEPGKGSTFYFSIQSAVSSRRSAVNSQRSAVGVKEDEE